MFAQVVIFSFKEPAVVRFFNVPLSEMKTSPCDWPNTSLVTDKKAFFLHVYPILDSVAMETHGGAGRGFVVLRDTVIINVLPQSCAYVVK